MFKIKKAVNRKINSLMQYPKGDLNPHSCNSQRILSPSCLPFHHSSNNSKIIGAKDGTRTRDPNLGKVMLYQLSYFRVFSTGAKIIAFTVSAKLFYTKISRQQTFIKQHPSISLTFRGFILP